MSIKGKKLLVLGATAGEITLIKRAQKFGVYVICTDNNTDYNLSPAKRIADEAWDISWSDIDRLEKKCKEEKIDGVTAGYSEFRVENLIKLCQKLNLPCYTTEEQLEITRDKVKFKNVCRKNGVPVVKEYANVEEVDEFPVIVKPVDRAGSIGISIASDKEELDAAYAYAMEMSVCKKVIIEKYMQEQKMDVYYAIEDGNIQLISSNDAIMAKDNGFDKVVQSAWLYPMSALNDYLEKVDESARRMIKDMGIQYGCIFFSGFVDSQKEFVFFECGFRLEGGHQYNYVEKKGVFNFLDLFIFHALTGTTNDMPRGIEENTELKNVTINFYANSGTVNKIEGITETTTQEECCQSIVSGRIGQKCNGEKAILSKMLLLSFCSESVEKIKQAVDRAYASIKITDEQKNDLIYDRIDTNQLLTWWEK